MAPSPLALALALLPLAAAARAPAPAAVLTTVAYIETEQLNASDWLRTTLGARLSPEDADCADQGQLLHRASGQCHELMGRGPCSRKQWLVLDRTAARESRLELACRPRPCAPGYAPSPGNGGRCVRHADACPTPMRFRYSLFGEARCVCDGRAEGRLRGQGPCEPLFRRGPCPEGRVLAPRFSLATGGEEAVCAPDPCRRRQRRGAREHAYPPTAPGPEPVRVHAPAAGLYPAAPLPGYYSAYGSAYYTAPAATDRRSVTRSSETVASGSSAAPGRGASQRQAHRGVAGPNPSVAASEDGRGTRRDSDARTNNIAASESAPKLAQAAGPRAAVTAPGSGREVGDFDARRDNATAETPRSDDRVRSQEPSHGHRQVSEPGGLVFESDADHYPDSRPPLGPGPEYAMALQYPDRPDECVSEEQLESRCELRMLEVLSGPIGALRVPVCINVLFRFAAGRVGKAGECGEDDSGSCAKVVQVSDRAGDWDYADGE